LSIANIAGLLSKSIGRANQIANKGIHLRIREERKEDRADPDDSFAEKVDPTSRAYDMLGRDVMSIVDGFETAGYHQTTVDGTNLATRSGNRGLDFVDEECYRSGVKPLRKPSSNI